MFDDAPTIMFPGYEFKAAGATVTADSIVIPLTALYGLTAGDAHASTGDARKIAWKINERIYQSLAALDAANLPTKMSVTRQPSVDNAGVITYSYYCTFRLEATGLDVLAE